MRAPIFPIRRGRERGIICRTEAGRILHLNLLGYDFWKYDFYSQPPEPEIVDDESDTASVSSSMSTSPKQQRKTRRSRFNIQPKINTNLSQRKKELVAKSSHVATPRLRLSTPQPYPTPRSRDPSPARGENRWRLNSADRWARVVGRACCNSWEMAVTSTINEEKASYLRALSTNYLFAGVKQLPVRRRLLENWRFH